jgi:glycosyltransferase involved in cell wall biosynthesis
MTPLAPIVLFTYKRLETLKITIGALLANRLAAESDLIIYSDGPKSQEDEFVIQEIRKYLQKITGFKSVRIHESKTNKGLATSIINGVSDVMSQCHKAIVLEDDLITSSNFLAFMNEALDQYQDQKEVYSISGYAFDLKLSTTENDAYFLNRHWPWGWASWQDRWQEVDWQVKDYIHFKSNSKWKKEFALLGSDVNAMLEKQINGNLDSWSIRWTYHIFKKKGLVLFPKVSKINNNGWDIDASNTIGINDRYRTTFDLSNQTNFDLPKAIEIHKKYQKALQLKMGVYSRFINKIKEMLFMQY